MSRVKEEEQEGATEYKDDGENKGGPSEGGRRSEGAGRKGKLEQSRMLSMCENVTAKPISLHANEKLKNKETNVKVQMMIKIEVQNLCN